MAAFFIILAVIACACAYATILYGILYKQQSNNAISWILWCILDVFALYGTFQKGEDIKLLVTFVIGTLILSVMLLFKKQYKFERTEAFSCALVVICFVISNSRFGSADVILWSSAIAIFAAGISYLKFLYEQSHIHNLTKIAASFFLTGMLCITVAALTGQTSLVIPVTCLVYWMIAWPLAFKWERQFVL